MYHVSKDRLQISAACQVLIFVHKICYQKPDTPPPYPPENMQNQIYNLKQGLSLHRIQVSGV